MPSLGNTSHDNQRYFKGWLTSVFLSRHVSTIMRCVMPRKNLYLPELVVIERVAQAFPSWQHAAQQGLKPWTVVEFLEVA